MIRRSAALLIVLLWGIAIVLIIQRFDAGGGLKSCACFTVTLGFAFVWVKIVRGDGG